MPYSKSRISGSGYTTLEYAGKSIAYLLSFTDSGQKSFGGGSGAGFDVVHPLGDRHPREIVTSRILNAGTITASIQELWNAPVWYQLAGLAGRRTLTDVWAALDAAPGPVTAQMLIRPPNGPIRGKLYHGVIITAIDDGETVSVGSLLVPRNISMAYTHTTAI